MYTIGWLRISDAFWMIIHGFPGLYLKYGIKSGRLWISACAYPQARLYGETGYQSGSWKGLNTQMIYKAEVNQSNDNFRFVIASIKAVSPEVIYEELYCPLGQDENDIKHLKSDLSVSLLGGCPRIAPVVRMAEN
ncbi:MAG: transposase [Endozoicomonas sp.]